MQIKAGMQLPIRAIEPLDQPIARLSITRDPHLLDIATQAVDAAGAGPLRPTGAVRDALAAGKLVGSRSDTELDSIERLLATGTPDPSTRRPIGNGMNDVRYATVLRGPDGTSIDAVSKPESAQGTQEAFSWQLARSMGIDHRVVPAARDSDGTAHIAFVPGVSLFEGKVRDARSMEIALTQSHLASDAPLPAAEAAQAARIESQLMQVFDYVLANSDRHGGNGIVDARSGVTLIDQGHVGRGQAGRPDVLVPGMRSTYLGSTREPVRIDPEVIDFLARRLDETTLRGIHQDSFRGARPVSTQGEHGRFNSFAASSTFIDGAVARLRHVIDAGEFQFGDPGETMVAPLRAVDDPPMGAGLRGVRNGIHQGHGGFGAFGMM